MADSTKETGLIIISMEKALNSLVMAQSIEATMLKVNLKAVGDMSGKMDNYMRVSGSMDSSMGQEFGEDPKVILI